MRMIKVGDKYLGLVASQRDAIRFDTSADVARVIAASITEGAEHVEGVSALGLTGARVVKLKTIADRTAESMRGLATDILDNGNS